MRVKSPFSESALFGFIGAILSLHGYIASILLNGVGQGPQHMLRPFLRLPSAPMHLPLPEKPNLPLAKDHWGSSLMLLDRQVVVAFFPVAVRVLAQALH